MYYFESVLCRIALIRSNTFNNNSFLNTSQTPNIANLNKYLIKFEIEEKVFT